MRLLFVGIALIIALLGGCVHHNQCGLSPNLYDEKEVYYDSQGNYKEKCPSSNFLKYRDFGLKDRD
ncbi:MAG: hypothetical protein ACTTH5_01070 [Wolinella sp.]